MFDDLPSLTSAAITQGAFVLILGLILGSFATALIHRVPKKQSWWKQKNRSQCPACKAPLKIPDLIPLYSWIRSGGQCRYCHEKISKTYPVIEGATALAALMAYLFLGFTPHAFFVIAAIPFLMASLVIDLRYMILPNQLTVMVGVLAILDIAFAIMNGMTTPNIAIFVDLLWIEAVPRILAGVIFSFFVWIVSMITKMITKRSSLGMGDIKFFLVAGLWLGMAPLPIFAILSGLFGISFYLGSKIIKKQPKDGIFPFGPSLILALYILLVFEPSHLM